MTDTHPGRRKVTVKLPWSDGTRHNCRTFERSIAHRWNLQQEPTRVPGAMMWIRWQDYDVPGNEDALALEDVVLTAFPPRAPVSMKDQPAAEQMEHATQWVPATSMVRAPRAVPPLGRATSRSSAAV